MRLNRQHTLDISRTKNSAIALAILMLQFFLINSTRAADQTILTKPERWLANLSQEDQRIALLKYQIRLAQKSQEVLTHAKDAKDRLWSTKILFCGHLLASRFATKNKDQQEAIALMADVLGDAISGKDTIENRKSNLEKAELANQKIAESISDSAENSFQKKHASDSDEMNKSLTVAAMLCASADSIQKERLTCAPKGTDVCKIARKMADELAPQLPMQLSSQLSLQTVFAVKSNFHMTMKLEYDHKHLQAVLINSGVSGDEMIKTMHRHAKGGVCQPSSPTKAFIDLGGVVSYQYRFNDGAMYTQVQITSCS